MKNSTKRGLLATLILSAGLAACGDLPTEAGTDTTADAAVTAAWGMGAERLVEEEFFDMTDYHLEFPCDADGEPTEDGELVRTEGMIYARFVAVFTPSGNVLATYHTMPIGLRGVGVDSGEPFRVRDAEHSNSVLTRLDYTESYRSTLTLVGTETGRRATIRHSGTFRVSEDRGIIVDRETERTECSGPHGMN